MKPGAENRKKTIALGVLGAGALCGVLYNVFSLFGGSSTPPPSVAPVATAPVPARGPAGGTAGRAGQGTQARSLGTTSANLDPTLDQAAMLRTEHLVYSGSGRNIFSATYTPVALPTIPKNVPPARPGANRSTGPVAPVGPPPPPAIPLTFFGTAQRVRAARQALLVSGDVVYLAFEGDIVDKHYKIDRIFGNSVQVTDLLNNNTQTLPMQ